MNQADREIGCANDDQVGFRQRKSRMRVMCNSFALPIKIPRLDISLRSGGTLGEAAS
jgi:hypothetical protein